MLFLLWWCFDDHLATSLGMPGLGHLDWWVVLLISIAFSGTVAVNSRRSS